MNNIFRHIILIVHIVINITLNNDGSNMQISHKCSSDIHP